MPPAMSTLMSPGAARWAPYRPQGKMSELPSELYGGPPYTLACGGELRALQHHTSSSALLAVEMYRDESR